jgi:hypothetical protein
MGGCSVLTHREFRSGNLAPVVIAFHKFGMTIQIPGITQWVRQHDRIGIRFVVQTPKTQYQLEALIACLLLPEDTQYLARLKEFAALKLDSERDDILAPLPAKRASNVTPDAGIPYHRSVHDGAGRLCAPEPEAWPATLHLRCGLPSMECNLADISTNGAVVFTTKPFWGESQDLVDLKFTLNSLCFLLRGTVLTIEHEHFLGIRFEKMRDQKREELEQILKELAEMHRIRPEYPEDA